jgi:hypothetical protein
MSMMVLPFMGFAGSAGAILAGRRGAAIGLWLAGLIGTLALFAFVALIAAVAVLLLIADTGRPMPRAGRGAGIFGTACLLVFLGVILANAVATAAECGTGLCPDDPTRYEALDAWLKR